MLCILLLSAHAKKCERSEQRLFWREHSNETIFVICEHCSRESGLVQQNLIVFFFVKSFPGRWKHKHTNSSSLIKTAAFHIPKCLKPKNQSSSQNQNSSKVCKSLKKSFHHASCLRSKSDNCLNRINNNNYNKVNCATSDGGGAISVDLASSADQSKRSFGQRVANVFASLVLNNHSQTTLVDPDPDHPESSDNLHHRVHLQRSSLRLRPTYSTKKSTVKKATSLERNINHRITEAEEQARRTRSLERNHRHLVTIDSTCRYLAIL